MLFFLLTTLSLSLEKEPNLSGVWKDSTGHPVVILQKEKTGAGYWVYSKDHLLGLLSPQKNREDWWSYIETAREPGLITARWFQAQVIDEGKQIKIYRRVSPANKSRPYPIMDILILRKSSKIGN